ncbi:hypothetical protein SAMN05443669_101970, partial [Flavobacterium xanthum]
CESVANFYTKTTPSTQIKNLRICGVHFYATNTPIIESNKKSVNLWLIFTPRLHQVLK